jgi:hypothetical protein
MVVFCIFAALLLVLPAGGWSRFGGNGEKKMTTTMYKTLPRVA